MGPLGHGALGERPARPALGPALSLPYLSYTVSSLQYLGRRGPLGAVCASQDGGVAVLALLPLLDPPAPSHRPPQTFEPSRAQPGGWGGMRGYCGHWVIALVLMYDHVSIHTND